MKKVTILYCVLIVVGCSCDDNNHGKVVPESRDVKDHMGDSNFLSFWNTFKTIVKTGNLTTFKSASFDSLRYEGKTVGIDEFTAKHFTDIFDDTLLSRIDDTSRVEFSDLTLRSFIFANLFVRREIKAIQVPRG